MGAQASDEVCGTPDERAGVQIPRRHSNQAGSIRENRTRLREPVHKDPGRRYQNWSDYAGDGGHASQRAPHPEQRQNHKLESDERGDSRDHENTMVHRHSTIANAARSESEGKESKDVKGKDKVKDAKNDSSKKAKSDD